MEQDYDKIIAERAEHVFDVMSRRVSAEDLARLRAAFELARDAHSKQKRKTGEPYILHPIAVATIAAEEMMLGVNPVIAAFLHDVVEDTDYTIEDIRDRFGDDVAFLVRVVTKQKKSKYEYSKQVDNYRQMLSSIEYDVRALLVKIADRLHNMRTLSSMRPDKQMKIAGETDYFYAPLANRLGLYNVKTELENLSFRFRTPHDYEHLVKLIDQDAAAQKERLDIFVDDIKAALKDAGIEAEVYVEYRKPYSLWRKMHKYGDDFNHLKYRHFTNVIYHTPEGISEKDMALRIYSVLSSRFREKMGGISNYIDSPKENGYQSFHVKLLPRFGRWQEVHISSDRMVVESQLGCVTQRCDHNIIRWIEKFRGVLQDIATHEDDGINFIESVVTAFYNDDIMTFTPNGKPIILPQKATVIDFAYEENPEKAEHAKYARINGFLSSIKAPLRRGDVVEIFTDDECVPRVDWLDAAVSFKARNAIRDYLDAQPVPVYNICPLCNPIPGEDVIGIRGEETVCTPSGCEDVVGTESRRITLHKRDCPTAIRLASQVGDNLLSIDYKPDEDTFFPVTLEIRSVDRHHLFMDLVDVISNTLNLNLDKINSNTVDNIVTTVLDLQVHSYQELQSIISHIATIPGVDEVQRRQ